MALPFRNNPEIKANWHNRKSGKTLIENIKKAYYELSVGKTPGWFEIVFREEKKRLGGSAEREEFWYSFLSFSLGSTFAKDLKMFLNEYVEEKAEEEKNTVRLYFEKGKWCARLSEALCGFGETKEKALIMLASEISVKSLEARVSGE